MFLGRGIPCALPGCSPERHQASRAGRRLQVASPSRCDAITATIRPYYDIIFPFDVAFATPEVRARGSPRLTRSTSAPCGSHPPLPLLTCALHTRFEVPIP